MKHALVENEDGVHLLNPAMGGEFTLCGDAFDAHSSENAPGRKFNHATGTRRITCPKCVEIILACRGVKIKEMDLHS